MIHLIRWLSRETDCLLPRGIGDVFQFFVDVRLIYPLSGFRKAIGFEHGFDHSSLMPPSGQLACLL